MIGGGNDGRTMQVCTSVWLGNIRPAGHEPRVFPIWLLSNPLQPPGSEIDIMRFIENAELCPKKTFVYTFLIFMLLLLYGSSF